MISALICACGLSTPLAQTLDTSHPVDYRTSTFTTSSQSEVDLALVGERVLSAWSSRRQNGGRYGVFGQWFDGEGRPLGEEFSLSAWREGHLVAPALAGTDRLAWAVWQSHGQDGDAGSIIARLVTPGGASEEILVNQTTVGHQGSPVVAALADGGAVIAWQDTQSDGSSTIRYRVLDRSGHPLSDERVVDEHGRQMHASVCATDAGFVIAWSSYDPLTGMPTGVRVRAFDGDGRAMGEVVAPVGSSGVEPVLAQRDGGAVLAWIEAIDGSYEVLATRLDRVGSRVGEIVRVSEGIAGVENAPAIALREDGTIAIAFNADGDDGSRDVRARLFDPALRPLGEAFVLTRARAGDQMMREGAGTRRLAFDGQGRLLCAWSGDADLGDASGAHVSMLGAQDLTLARGVGESMCPVPLDATTDMAAGPHIPPTYSPRDREQEITQVIEGPGGIGFLAVTNTGWTPPDPHMAVGRDHIVVMTNGQIAFFTKDGTRTFVDEIEDSFGFWGSVGATGFVFDPEVLYDPAEDRFVAMAAEAFAPGNRSYVLIAVSDDGDPNGSWHKYRFETTSLAGDLFDSPNIAVTSEAVIVTGDGFGFGANYPVFTFDKASLYAGNPPAITRQTTLATSTQSAGIPPTSLPDPGVLYMIEHQEGNNRSRVRLIAMRDALGSPTFTTFSLQVPAYSSPADPQQMGTGTRPETFDARFWSVEYVNGRLWATHHVNSPIVRARWYEIDMRGWPTSGQNPVLVQSGEIQPTDSTHTYFSSIAASSDGLAAVCYAQSSTSEFISMRTAFRLPDDPPGTMRLGDAQQQNTGPYTQTRWGDYSSCEIDPVDGTTIWSHHEWAQNDSWRTWVASIVNDLGCPADLDGNGILDADDFFLYLDLFSSGDPRADITGNGVIDANDFFAYLDLFAAGC